MQEYKTALIAEAVTGKIHVRAYVIPAANSEEDSYEDIDEDLQMAAEDTEDYQTTESE